MKSFEDYKNEYKAQMALGDAQPCMTSEIMIEALNSLEVTDSSCSGGECEYVNVENSEKNRLVLISAGFTREQIEEAVSAGDGDIDISYLAFNHTDAVWWTNGKGFLTEGELD